MIIEVREAGAGRGLLRVATSALFDEHAAPGLLELFAQRANDLDVELSSHNPGDFESLLRTRTVDAAIGPQPAVPDPSTGVHALPELPGRRGGEPGEPDHPDPARDQRAAGADLAAGAIGGVSTPGWCRTCCAASVCPTTASASSAATRPRIEEAKRGKGLAPAVSFAVSQDLGQRRPAAGQLAAPAGPGRLEHPDPDREPGAAGRGRPGPFVTTPRATQAMLRGFGVTVCRFQALGPRHAVELTRPLTR